MGRKNEVKTILLVTLLAVSATAFAEGRRSRLNADDDEYKYRSRYNREYQYDLSRERDRLKYDIDERAKLRDELEVDPRRELERDLGEYGGGVKR